MWDTEFGLNLKFRHNKKAGRYIYILKHNWGEFDSWEKTSIEMLDSLDFFKLNFNKQQSNT